MIRKITPFIAFFCLIFNSCTTDIEVNSPGLQATIDDDNELFRPGIKKAVLHDDGTLVIQGSTGSESISFTITSSKTGTYKINQQAVNAVTFQNSNTKFSSENGVSQGQIVVDEIYNNEISGSFYFQDLKGSDGKSITFRNGWFYRLPIENFVPEKEEVIEEEVIVEEEEEEEEEINECLLNASLTAKVNGVDMITDDHDAIPFGVNNPSILIKAKNDTEEITIVFPINVTPGQYSLTGSGDYSATYSLDNDKSSAISGTLTITDHNSETQCITGTYEFTTRSGVVVTEGVFDFGY
ncbi:hypothetical protein GCM10022393_36990 [Aquimarina addita]|uniref:DUF4382 domain-containing protein n=1 Tax=Aquimarina addita TaxID=870485 RepID=A0ABP6UU91_9FLAO